MGYDLRLYASDRSAGSGRICIGHFRFAAGDDLSAVKHAKSAYAGSIGNCDHVVLLDSRGKPVWQSSSKDVHDEGGGFLEDPGRAKRFA
jgi:hypothetical protein